MFATQPWASIHWSRTMHFHLTRRQALRLATLAVATRSLPTQAQINPPESSSAWPQKPVRIIVPGGAGGVPDIRARWLADRLQPLLGQAVVVENKAAAGGNLAMEAAARSAPDGHTLVMMHLGTMAMNPHLYERVGYDPLKDFVAITRVGVGPMALLVSASSPLYSVQDLQRLSRSQSGTLFFGSPGVGTPPHLASELFKRSAAIGAEHVPFSSPPQASGELMAGRLTWVMDGLPLAVPLVKSGRLRALAVTSRSRFGAWPDVPTMEQVGLPDCEFSGWTGLAAPAGTPTRVIDRLYADISTVLTSADAKQWFAELGNEAGNDSPQATAAIVRDAHAKWGAVIKAAGIRLQ
jgi:tripartite-type tricarboxylate transporter receptor subunit TctC